MKKFVILCSLFFVLVPCLSGWAMWVDEISEGEVVYFNTGSFSSSGGPISYQTLSDICASINQNIVDGNFDKMYPFYDYQSHFFVAEIVTLGNYSSPRYVIRLTDTSYTNPISPLYFVDGNQNYVYALDDTKNPHILGPIFDRLTSLVNYLDGVEGYIDGIEGSLNTVIGHIDGIESSLSTTNSRLLTIANRLIKSVNGSSYTVSDLVYNSWIQLQGIGGYVDGLESSTSNILSALNTTNQKLDTISELVTDSEYPYTCISTSSVDSNGDELPRVYIPYESTTDYIAFLNENYQYRKIDMYNPSTGQYVNRYFIYATLSSNNYIIVYVSTSVTSPSDPAQCYLADRKHNIIVSASPTYSDKLNSLESVLGRIENKIGSVAIDLNPTRTKGVATTVSLAELVYFGIGEIIEAIPDGVDVEEIIPYLQRMEGTLNSIYFDVEDIKDSSDSINSSLSNISSYSEDIASYCDSILETNQAILAHLDSSDLADDSFVSGLVDDWGDHLVYTVLNSDNVLSLFNSAFGDLPSSLEWGQARLFFQQFYRGDE